MCCFIVATCRAKAFWVVFLRVFSYLWFQRRMYLEKVHFEPQIICCLTQVHHWESELFKLQVWNCFKVHCEYAQAYFTYPNAASHQTFCIKFYDNACYLMIHHFRWSWPVSLALCDTLELWMNIGNWILSCRDWTFIGKRFLQLYEWNHRNCFAYRTVEQTFCWYQWCDKDAGSRKMQAYSASRSIGRK